jgi:hypothetical protein
MPVFLLPEALLPLRRIDYLALLYLLISLVPFALYFVSILVALIFGISWIREDTTALVSNSITLFSQLAINRSHDEVALEVGDLEQLRYV